MSSDRDTWLAGTTEKAIDPNQIICDPHHHLWDHPDSRYLLPELRADTGSGHQVVSTVFIECGSAYRDDGPAHLRPVGETELVRAIAETSASSRSEGAVVAGIVGFADLTLGSAVEEVLTAHMEAGGRRFKGIRHASGWDPSPEVRNSHTAPPAGLLVQPEFGQGLATLGSLGLSFDAWLYHPQLDDLADLAERHPEVPIVLDHLGGPLGIGPYADRREAVAEQWRPPMRRLAACENVWLKLGGIGMTIFGLGWHRRERPPTSAELAAAWGPTITWCIEQFGPERCMFESNFPVDKRSCSYTVLWNTFQRLTADASADERQLLFHDTAATFYRLDSDPG